MANNQTVKSRLLIFINSIGMAVSTFEKKSGLSNAYIKNFKGNISAEKLEGILTAFPELNRTWLLTGEGEMLNTKTSQVIQVGEFNNNGNIRNSQIDNRHYYSDSPDVLRAQIEQLERILQEKEERIKEKDSQIKEKDSQIKTLLAILNK